jgi:hypothetical protein
LQFADAFPETGRFAIGDGIDCPEGRLRGGHSRSIHAEIEPPGTAA